MTVMAVERPFHCRPRRYVPGAIMQRLTSNELSGAAPAAELREITVLFIAVDGIELSDNDLDAATQRGHDLMLEIQGVLYAVEGSVNKMQVDDKGLLVLAAFGLPPLPHPNDPERGITAAMELVSRIGRSAVDQLEPTDRSCLIEGVNA